MTYRLAIFSPNRNKYSETFIHRQIEGLSGEKYLFYEGYLPHMLAHPPDQLGVSLLAGWKPPWWKRKRDFQALREQALESRLVKTLKQHKIQIALAQYGPTGVAVLNACRAAGIPLIVHFHGYDAYRDDTLGSYGKRYPELFEKATALVAVSKDMEAQLRRLGAEKEQVHRIPYGIDPQFFRPGTQPKTGPPHFLAVGRLVPKKGPLNTLKAFSLALKSLPDARLTLVGEGELLPEAKKWVAERGLTGKVRFPGKQPPTEIRTLMQEAHIFVQHSMLTPDNDSEGLPLSILEAAACGLPVVATHHAGIPEAVIEGETGFLVASGDIEGMARKMIQLGTDPELASQFGKAGRKWIQAQFHQKSYFEKLDVLIQSCL